MILLDCEVSTLPPEEILANAPAWSIEEAKTRIPKNYTREDAKNEWLSKDEAGYQAKLLDEAGLSPFSSKVALVTWWVNGKIEQWFHDNGSDHSPYLGDGWCYLDEEALLIEVMDRLRIHVNSAAHVANWNLLGYDLPMMVRRCWLLGVPVPRSIFNPLGRYPYNEHLIDLMQVFKAGKREEKHTSLNNALKLLGLPEKEGSGKDFPKLWRTDRPKAMSYARTEMERLAMLVERMGLIEQSKSRLTSPSLIASMEEMGVLP